jgi:osmotically-inducible protein OsmY
MKHVYKLAFILTIGASFALAQAGAGSQSTPPTYPSQQQPGAQAGQTGTSSADTSARAQSDIQSALRKQMPASADNVTVSVTDDNKVQLSGTVNSDSEKSQVEQIAHSAAPDADIVNKLQVSSSPSSMPPSSTEPPSSSKPPVLRMVAYQQSGSTGQGSSGSQDTQPPQNTNPSTSSPGAGMGQAADTSANAGDVQDKIQKAIQQDSSLASSNINVNVNNNKVELTGTVSSKDQEKTAKQIAQSNAGGMKVVNHLKVAATEPAPSTPSSPSTPPKN